MDILRKYKHFINEAVDSDKEVKGLNDVPNEVIESAKKIVGDMFDRVRKPTFEYEPGTGLVMKFQVTQQDFNYIDENEPLTLDVTEGARKKRTYDVKLTYLDSVSETYEIQYVVNFEMFEFEGDEDIDDEDEDELNFEDDEVTAKYQELVAQWKSEQGPNTNQNPGEGTRKRLWAQARKEAGDSEEYFDEDEADFNIKKGKIKIQDLDEVEDFEDDEV
jgi:hypothetical protein